MRTTYDISFYCRSSKQDRNGQAPIEMSINLNGSRKFLNCPLKCSPAEFNKKRKPQYLQKYIESQRVNVATAVSELVNMGVPVTAERLKEYIKTGSAVRSYTISCLFDEYFELLSKRVGRTLTQTVYDKYVLVRNMFAKHIDFNKECTAITPAVVQEFYVNLQSEYKDSTSGGYMTKLKTVIRFGMDNNHIKINPFQNIKINKGKTEIETITYQQLQTIINHKFIPRVQKVADMFIFACGSGLAYCDCMALQPDDFVEMDGKICVFKERQKTGVKFYSVMLPWAVDIYNKYGVDFSQIKISNQKTNSYLQEIADICGIDRRITFHKARHFYALYTLNKGMPVTSVQRMLGHSNISQTMHYTRALEKTILGDFDKVFK